MIGIAFELFHLLLEGFVSSWRLHPLTKKATTVKGEVVYGLRGCLPKLATTLAVASVLINESGPLHGKALATFNVFMLASTFDTLFLFWKKKARKKLVT